MKLFKVARELGARESGARPTKILLHDELGFVGR
jgi:hypothetical protein